jgi:23S rRNA (cytosine1962-C5)-methyltransferase
MTEKRLILKAGREKSILKRHPWIFSGAILRIEGDPAPGETVEIRTSGGEFLARAALSPRSQIVARVWSLNPDEAVEREFFRKKIFQALERRRCLGLLSENGAARLIYSESDGLPGLIVDKYAGVLVMQCTSVGVEYHKETISDLLMELTGADSLFERSDAESRILEGLPPASGLLMGKPLPETVEFVEGSLDFEADVRNGHKTGFYLDQKDNRECLRGLAGGKEVLDCFCYTGGFTLNALAGKAASVVSVDSSETALEAARRNLALNGLGEENCRWLKDDVFQTLRRFCEERRRFDLAILDPPKFAQNMGQVDQALRGYKDINRLAFLLLRPGGILFTFSCSGLVSEEQFQKTVAWAALDAGVEGRIIRRLAQGPDHPVPLHFPEGAYLKGLVVA